VPADVSIVTRPAIVGRPVSFVASTLPEYRYVFCLYSTCLMADPNLEDTSRTTDSTQVTGLIASSVSLPGLANKFLSTDTSATAMARFSLELRDLEAAAALEALGMVPETQWPGTEASTLELSTDSEVTFRKILGSAEVLATRPGVDPLEVSRPLPEFSWITQSPQATSPSIIVRPGMQSPSASHVFGPLTIQVGPENPTREDLQSSHWSHTEEPTSLHWSPHSEFFNPAAPSEVRDVSQGTVWPTVGISPSVIAASRVVDVDTRVDRPSLPHFVASDTRSGQCSPIVAAATNTIHVDMCAAPSPLSRCVDSDTHTKRLYAATHAPLAPPTTPIADLLCHERDVMSSTGSDSDYPPASQRENRPPLLGTHFRCPSGSSQHSTAALRQYAQLTSQLAATVQQQLERTQTEAAQREHRMFNDIAERDNRLLSDAAERDRRVCELEAQREQRLLADARQARELEAQRQQLLLHDAKCTREALLADVQLQRDREAQREIDLRRDLYDLSRQRSRAAALEAELKCLKATTGQPTVAYEVVEVPVLDDIPPPDVDTVVQVSPSRPNTPVDNLVVQRPAPDMTQRQPSMSASIVHRPDIADALIRHPHAADTRTVYSCHSTSTSTLQPSFMPSSSHKRTMYRSGPEYTQPQQFYTPPVVASDPVFTQYQSDTQPRMPATSALADQVYTHTPPHIRTFHVIRRLMFFTIQPATDFDTQYLSNDESDCDDQILLGNGRVFGVEWRQNIWNQKHPKIGINRRLGRRSISSGDA